MGIEPAAGLLLQFDAARWVAQDADPPAVDEMLQLLVALISRIGPLGPDARQVQQHAQLRHDSHGSSKGDLLQNRMFFRMCTQAPLLGAVRTTFKALFAATTNTTIAAITPTLTDAWLNGRLDPTVVYAWFGTTYSEARKTDIARRLTTNRI